MLRGFITRRGVIRRRENLIHRRYLRDINPEYCYIRYVCKLSFFILTLSSFFLTLIYRIYIGLYWTILEYILDYIGQFHTEFSHLWNK